MKTYKQYNIAVAMKKNANPVFDDVRLLSPKQVLFAFYMTEYRRKYNLSQKEMAEICSLYGEPSHVKFTQNDISSYEIYKTIPTPPKFQILMNTMNIKSL